MMKYFFTFVVIAMSWALSAQNLIVNPSFETENPSDAGKPESWEKLNNGVTVYWGQNTKSVDGSQSVKMDVRTGGGTTNSGVLRATSNIVMEDNADYVYSYWVYATETADAITENTTGDRYVRFMIPGATSGGYYFPELTETEIPDDKWTFVSGEFTANKTDVNTGAIPTFKMGSFAAKYFFDAVCVAKKATVESITENADGEIEIDFASEMNSAGDLDSYILNVDGQRVNIKSVALKAGSPDVVVVKPYINILHSQTAILTYENNNLYATSGEYALITDAEVTLNENNLANADIGGFEASPLDGNWNIDATYQSITTATTYSGAQALLFNFPANGSVGDASLDKTNLSTNTGVFSPAMAIESGKTYQFEFMLYVISKGDNSQVYVRTYDDQVGFDGTYKSNTGFNAITNKTWVKVAKQYTVTTGWANTRFHIQLIEGNIDAGVKIVVDDIKVFEVEDLATTAGYWSTSATSTDWNTAANWTNGAVPTETDDIIIPAGASFYPVIDETVICNNLTIGRNASVEIASNGALTVTGILSNSNSNDGIVLNYTETTDAQLLFEGTTDATIVHALPTSTNAQWHPFATGLISDVQTSDNTASLSGTGDLYIRKHTESTNVYENADAILNGTTGYLTYSTGGHTLTVKGTLSGNEQSFASLAMDGSGFHLLANTLSSKLDLSKITVPGSNFEQGVWVFNPSTEDFTLMELTGEIMPGSSFFVKASSAGGSIVLPVAAKTTGAKKNELSQAIVNIRVENGSDSDVAKIRFNENALANKDNYDLSKMFSLKENKLSVHSSVDGRAVSVNSLPSNFEGSIPVSIRLGAEGKAKLILSKADLSYDGFVYVNINGEKTLLESTFSQQLDGNVGEEIEVNIEFNKKALTVQDLANQLSIFSDGKQIRVNLNGANKGQISVYSIHGVLLRQTAVSNTENAVDLDVAAGVYLVKVTAGKEQLSQKIVLE